MHKYLFCFKGIQFLLKDFYAMDSLDYGTFFQAINEKTKIEDKNNKLEDITSRE